MSHESRYNICIDDLFDYRFISICERLVVFRKTIKSISQDIPDRQDIAQAESVSISISSSSLRTRASGPIAFFTNSNWGRGVPRQRLERVQVPALRTYLLVVLSNNWTRGLRPPVFSIKSRVLGESPAIFPRAQTAYNSQQMNWIQEIAKQSVVTCSATSICGELNNLTSSGIPPLSMIDWICWWLPDATFVIAHAHSTYRNWYKIYWITKIHYLQASLVLILHEVK